jgi:hypothetical protein
MKIRFLGLLLFVFSVLPATIHFDYEFTLESTNINVDLRSLQVFDYNNDNIDELICSFSDGRIIIYSLSGDIIETYQYPLSDDNQYGKCQAFEFYENTKFLVITSFANCNLTLELLDLNDFSIVNSISTEIPDIDMIEKINDIDIVPFEEDYVFYVGLTKFTDLLTSSERASIYKFLFHEQELSYLHDIYCVGNVSQYFNITDKIISIGYNGNCNPDISSVCYTSFDVNVISNELDSENNNLLSLDGSYNFASYPYTYYDYPVNLVILSNNDHFQNEYGTIIHYLTRDSSDGNTRTMKCYDPNFSEILWESNVDSYLKNVSSSTTVEVNNEDHYIMYFIDDEIYIRDRITGNIVYNQGSTITPFNVLRKSNNELLFFVEDSDNNAYKVYTLQNEIEVATEDIPKSTPDFNLSNFPNPFNPATNIKFSLSKNSNVNLTIYNVKGQKIKTLANDFMSSGEHTVLWNGKDDSNNHVSSGVYMYKLCVDDKNEVMKKCILMK